MAFTDFLAKKGVIDEKEAVHLGNHTEGYSGTEKKLTEKGFSQKDIIGLRAEYMNIPVKSLGGTAIPRDILKFIPEESASFYKFVPVGAEDGVLQVGIVDPDNIEALDALQFISSKIGMPFKVFLITQADFESVLQSYGGLTGEVSKALSELGGGITQNDLEAMDIGAVAEGAEEKEEEEKKDSLVEDAPVTKMVAVILRHATEGNASDIHIEHTGEKVRVRFRVDGILHTSILLPGSVHAAVVSRIKILASLKLDERRKPQDGRFSTRIEGRKIDFRISTMPAYYGEKVVMRILDAEKGVKTLTALGMKDSDLATVREALDRPYGMVLLTGPTGSGKTTTLYAMLNELDRDSDNIISLEDPVEYSIPGVNQSQMRPEIGYTFATGLRSILRQDPDVIMVGEIRDKETAQLAVQAALTGHLVFSTIHTNSAVGAVTRLMDMGVDPFLIAPTLLLVIGQRLVSSLCEGAGKEVPLTNATKMIIDKQFSDLPEIYRKEVPTPESLFEAAPSAECPAGVRGRQAVFEVLKITPEIQEAILKHAGENEVYKTARSQGMFTMKEDAMMKAFAGKIPFVEVNKL